MAIDNLPNASDESRLSGAYIRSLVKQLTTSKPLNANQNSTKNNATNQTVTTNKGMAKPNNHPQGHKKQVRRRLHTSRPYQERLLNMAEARKEIVTALKFHRAAMKQANEQRQKQQLEDFSHGMHPTLDEEEIAKMRSIGEQHQIEWDDTLDLMKSAWWFKYLKSVDFDKEIKREEQIYCKNNEEFMEFPAWLSANNDQSFLQQHLHDSCSDDTTLPWMDIGDIDGLDDEWLS
ncbi:unnamed protein product [Amaranthus hypochondriacus]